MKFPISCLQGFRFCLALSVTACTVSVAADDAADPQFWSFRPVAEPALPDVQDAWWPRTAVDRFILARLEAEELSPTPAAARRTLIRRVTFDLTGLPPTPDEIETFLADDSPNAYERLVDRLLASPAYGERWGRHWLDVVRYCDSRDARHTGQSYDVNEAWRYRDWVVKEFNRDAPYDDFIMDQVAGDLRADAPGGDRIDRIVATSVLAFGEWGSGDADAKKMLTDIVDDQIGVIGETFLGLSLNCARCHEHKFDPISTEDYYALAGIFFSSQIATPRTDAPLLRIPVGSRDEISAYERLKARAAAIRESIKDFKRENEVEDDKKLEGPVAEKLNRLEEDLKSVDESLRRLPVSLAIREGGVPGTPHAGFHDARVHIRGSYDQLGDVVPRGFPRVLSGDDSPRIESGSGRLELARWIASDTNPLTARVMANRIWLYHFGEGLVRTPGNFGAQGERPTHPNLLDFLAGRFVGDGWSIKAIHRLLVSSATYRQSTRATDVARERDPENRLWSRANVRRLEVEAIRDALLAVAGSLERHMGGPSAARYPKGYSRAEYNEPDFSSRRRTIYVMTIRSEKSMGPFVLDAADPERLVHRRTVSTVAPQALYLMNDPFVLDQMSPLVERLWAAESTTLTERIEMAYTLLYGRPPRDEEAELGLAFLSGGARSESDPEGASRRAWERYCHALVCANEFIYLE